MALTRGSVFLVSMMYSALLKVWDNVDKLYNAVFLFFFFVSTEATTQN